MLDLMSFKPPLLSVIIVAYKSRDEIAGCLGSLPRQLNDREIEVVVIDNSQDDGTREIVLRQYPWVKYIAPAMNLGFGRANNLGYAEASSLSEFVLFLNPDTVCNETALAHCIARLQADERIGLISPKLVLADGSMDLACRRGVPMLWDGFCRAAGLAARWPKVILFSGYNLTHLSEGGTYDVGAINGAFMLARRDVFEAVASSSPPMGVPPFGGTPVEDLSLKIKEGVPTSGGPPAGDTPDEEEKLKLKEGGGRAESLELRAESSDREPQAYNLPPTTDSDGLLRTSTEPDLLAMTGGDREPKAYSLPPSASNPPPSAIGSEPKPYSLPPTASSSSAVFDENFFMYGDDLDLCIRVARAGWRIVYDGAVSITHLKGTSVAKDYSAMSSAIFDANRDVYLKHFNPNRSRLVALKYHLAFGLWKRVAKIRAGLKGHRRVRPL